MKKFIVFMLTAVVLFSALVVPSLAATKADLLDEASKSPVYKYVKVALENAAKTIEVTDEQADQIMPYVKNIVAILDTDNGPSVGDGVSLAYTDEQVTAVFENLDAICAILNYTYTLVPSAKPVHRDDVVLNVYDANGSLIFTFDGDAIAKTDAASENNTWAVLALGGVALLAGAAMFVVSRKKLVTE